jgi:hypothetical protein
VKSWQRTSARSKRRHRLRTRTRTHAHTPDARGLAGHLRGAAWRESEGEEMSERVAVRVSCVRL